MSGLAPAASAGGSVGPAPSAGEFDLLGSDTPPTLSLNAQTWFDRGTYPQNATYSIEQIKGLTDCGSTNKDPMYHLARIGGNEIVRLAIGLAVSQRAVFLDAIFEIMDYTYNTYRVHDSTLGTYRISSGAECQQILDVAIYHGGYSIGVLALELNRNLTSPKGYNYAAAADKWKPFIGPDAEKWWTSGTPWEGLMNDWGEGAKRAAKPGEFPYILRGYTHPTERTVLYAYVMWRLFGANDERYLADFKRHAQELLQEANRVVDTDTGGFVWGWGVKGHKRMYDATPTTYGDYRVDTSLLLALLGVGNGWTTEHCQKVAITYDKYAFDQADTTYLNDAENSTIAKSIVGDAARTVNTASGAVDFTVYADRPRRNRAYVSDNSFPMMIVYDSGTRLRPIFEAYYNAGVAKGDSQSSIPIAFMAHHIIAGT